MRLPYTVSRPYGFYATVPNYQLISYDVQNINAVLILNFFRFLDNLIPYRNNYELSINDDEEAKKMQANLLYHEVDKSTEDSKQLISNIYQTIENMTDDELSTFLRTIGMKASDTMEFNFFGAHQIDFNTLIKIKGIKEELLMADFILSLQKGDVNELLKVKDQFPEVFQSYRFIDYLLTKTVNQEILSLLTTWRFSCKTPGWYPMNEKFNIKTESENKVYSESDTDRTHNSLPPPKS